jgi:ubiquinone/menaquinone biosynthesis C-methylase UbiE
MEGKNLEYIIADRIKRFGPEVGDPEKQAIGFQALFYGGTTLRLWNEAIELKIVLLSASALKKGQNVFLIGKYADESGITEAVRSLIGPKGRLSVEEVGEQAVDVFQKAHTTPGTKLMWDFHQLDSVPEDSLDRVIIFNAACHVANWPQMAKNIDRVLRSGGRVIVADVPWGGKELFYTIGLDKHLQQPIANMLSGMGIKDEHDLPHSSPEDLAETFGPVLKWNRSFSWKGMFLFYGGKGGEPNNPPFDFPTSTLAVKEFLRQKPVKTPYDLFSKVEQNALASAVGAGADKKLWGKVLTFGGGLEWLYEHSESVVKPMYENLKVKQGDRVLILGEQLVGMGFRAEMQKRVGPSGEIVEFDMNSQHRALLKRLWGGESIPMKHRHQWDYPYADTYPDNYFDMIWIPQGVHHAIDWNNIAPRMVRVLKPGCQILMIECRNGQPGYFAAIDNNFFMRCIVEKLYWALDIVFGEMPDYSTTQLATAFNGLLKNVYSIEWSGWLLFWGYKK